MIIPLGLNIKLAKPPWVTALISVFIVIVSTSNFKSQNELQLRLNRSQALVAMKQSEVRLALFLCEAQRLYSEQICSALKEVRDVDFQSRFEFIKQLIRSGTQAGVAPKELESLVRSLSSSAWIKAHETVLRDHPEYQYFRTLEAQFLKEVGSDYEKNSVLSKMSLDVKSLLKAQFTHANFSHLIGNLLFFVFLSVFLELRIGALLYGVIFLASGSLGLMAHLAFSEVVWMPLLGASANVSGIAGAFAYLFFKRKMRVLLVSIVFNKIVLVPVYFFFPVLILAGDLSGLIEGRSSGVAHLAHLVGFVTGGALAALFKSIRRLPEPFFYHEEYERFCFARNLEGDHANQIYMGLLELNPDNPQTHEKILSTIRARQDWKQMTRLQKAYVKLYLPRFLSDGASAPFSFEVVQKIGPGWPIKLLFASISMRTLQTVVGLATARHDRDSIVRIHEIASIVHPRFVLDPHWVQLVNSASLMIEKKEGSSVQAC